MTGLEIAEICARSGANCGSIFLDLRFRELVKVNSGYSLTLGRLLIRHRTSVFFQITLYISIQHRWLTLVSTTYGH
jgi:hypothetical protein